MGGRLHQMHPEAFLHKVSGLEPTATECRSFVKPLIGKEVKSERKLAVIFVCVKSMQSVLDTAQSKTLRVVDTASHKAADGYNKPADTLNDVGFYLHTPISRAATDLIPEQGKRSKIPQSERQARNLECQSWHWLAIPVELRWENTVRAPSADVGSNGASGEAAVLHLSASTPADPTEGEQFIRDTAQGAIALGQFAEYQHNVFTHQHRCFLYAIYVRKRGARMIYSDRTGTRMSEEFDWTDDNSFLHRFVWKLAHMSLEQLGYDPTAELATDSQCRPLEDAKGDNTLPPHVVKAVDNAFDGQYPIYKLRITVSEPFPDEAFPAKDPVILPPSMSEPLSPTTPLEQQAKEQNFLVARPHFHTDALVGRCTKCYIAYDIAGRRFCFLKDYWRPLVVNRSRPEHLVYNRLHSVGTPCIPTLVCGGDVDGPRKQVTQVQDYLPSKGRPVPLVHYRIAIAEIARPLHTFSDFTELAFVFAQVIGAHDHAVKYAGILHRDISVGNIMIGSGSRGLLIDWDLSRLVSELGTGPMKPERGGTWPFQSALSQRWPRKPYCVSDDIESFIHAFRYMVLKYHVVNIPDLHEFVVGYFESFATVRVVFDGQVWMVKRGGHSKWAGFQAPRSVFSVKQNPRLQELLDDIAYGCYESYAAIGAVQMDEVYGL
ncbi:hypothetical protein GY45DRAFT_1211529, partial [Cubamyces sp. BRFM 1775]